MRKFILISFSDLADKSFGYSVLIILGIAVMVCGIVSILKKTKIDSEIAVGLIFISLPLILFGVIKLCCWF